MSDILRRAFDRAVLAAERRAWTPGRLGMTNADGTVTISVPDRPNWVYVALGPDGSQGVTVARNDAGVPLRVHLPVKMRREESGVMAIQGVYNMGGLADVGATDTPIVTEYGVPPHPHTHGELAGLTDDDHTQYPLLAGRSGGQTIYGGTASGDDLTLESTSHATKGAVDIQPNGGATTVGGTLGVSSNATFSGNVSIGTTATPTRLMIYGDDAEATTPGSAVNAAIRIAKGGLTAYGERAEVQFAMGGANFYPGAAVSATYSHWASGANPLGTDLRFATAPTNGTLTDRMSITRNGDVGIGTTAPASKLDVNGDAIIRGPMYSTGPLGWKHSKANVAHNTPTAIAKYTLPGSTASAVLVSIVATGTSIQATKLFSVTTAWTTEVVTDLGGALYGFGGLVLTADMDTATTECTLTLTQTNSAALPANIHISIQPLATAGDATMTFDGL